MIWWWVLCGLALALYLAKLGFDVWRARRDARHLINATVRRVVWSDPAAVDNLSPARRRRAVRWIRSLKDEDS